MSIVKADLSCPHEGDFRVCPCPYCEIVELKAVKEILKIAADSYKEEKNAEKSRADGLAERVKLIEDAALPLMDECGVRATNMADLGRCLVDETRIRIKAEQRATAAESQLAAAKERIAELAGELEIVQEDLKQERFAHSRFGDGA